MPGAQRPERRVAVGFHLAAQRGPVAGGEQHLDEVVVEHQQDRHRVLRTRQLAQVVLGVVDATLEHAVTDARLHDERRDERDDRPDAIDRDRARGRDEREPPQSEQAGEHERAGDDIGHQVDDRRRDDHDEREVDRSERHMRQQLGEHEQLDRDAQPVNHAVRGARVVSLVGAHATHPVESPPHRPIILDGVE